MQEWYHLSRKLKQQDYVTFWIFILADYSENRSKGRRDVTASLPGYLLYQNHVLRSSRMFRLKVFTAADSCSQKPRQSLRTWVFSLNFSQPPLSSCFLLAIKNYALSFTLVKWINDWISAPCCWPPKSLHLTLLVFNETKTPARISRFSLNQKEIIT